MRLRGISVRGVLLAVVVAAIELAIVRALRARGEQAAWLLAIVVATLPMATLLEVGLLTGLRGKWHAFWVGFEVAGGLAFSAIVLSAYAWPNLLDDALVPLFDRVGDALSRRFGEEFIAGEEYARVEEFVFLPIAVSAPLLAVALAGGLLAGWLRVRVAFERFADWPRRPWLAGATWLLVLFALPGLAIELYLRRTIDPFNARLAGGRLAIVDNSGGSGFIASFEDGTTALLPNRTRVRVDDDRAPATVQRVGPDGRNPLVDMRAVNVTVVEGERKGRVTFLPRGFLRSVR